MIDLGLDTWTRGSWTVLVVSGELDVATAPRLRQRLVALVEEGARHVAVDLSAVGLLDSTGLGVLIGAVKRLRGHGGDLVVVCDDDRIRRVFELTRLDRAIDLHRTLEEVPG